MALKKSQLYASLWQSCDELRGGMDASQYKDYVLTLLFMKYVSKGQFYTPAEVSRVMAKVIGIRPDTGPDQTLYDRVKLLQLPGPSAIQGIVRRPSRRPCGRWRCRR